jgi:acetylglutamate kinase
MGGTGSIERDFAGITIVQMEKLFIIKIGGKIIDHEGSLLSFLFDFSKVPGHKILVHGGGKVATQIGEKLGIVSKYIDGRRITDAETVDLVTMVYGGLINKRIVAKLQALNCKAIGLTGADANLIPAKKRPVSEIDYGFVGDVDAERLAADSWQLFIENNLVPVVAPLTHDGQGQILNTNADTIASALAVLLSTIYDVRLIYCFEKKGVLKDVNNEEDVVHLIDKDIYRDLRDEQALAAGILPKLDNAFEALKSGVREVLIGHADDLLQNVSDRVTGTLIK